MAKVASINMSIKASVTKVIAPNGDITATIIVTLPQGTETLIPSTFGPQITNRCDFTNALGQTVDPISFLPAVIHRGDSFTLAVRQVLGGANTVITVVLQ